MYVVNNTATADRGAGDILVERVLEFVRFVRENDFQIGVREELDALVVAKHCDITDQKRLHWGLRSLLCSSSNEWQRFDKLYHVYWLQHVKRSNFVQGSSPGGKLSVDTVSQDPTDSQEIRAVDKCSLDDDGDQEIGQGGTRSGASIRQTHMQTDFRFLTDGHQMQLMEHMVERLARRFRRR